MHKVALIVLDGWGYREEVKDNAIAEAKTPRFDALWEENPHTLLAASGEAVGLPDGQMGNSEVGHTTIGAGTVLDTDLVRIGKVAREGRLGEVPEIAAAIAHTNGHNSTLHFVGLIGSGGVHAHSDHLYALLRAARTAGVARVAVHGFTDGRDTAPQSGAEFLGALEAVVAEVGNATIASLSGRYFGMDRDNNWDRLAKAEEVIMKRGDVANATPSYFLRERYVDGVVDEHLAPTRFANMPIAAHDAVVMYDFRPDRARMLAKHLSEFATRNDVYLVTMTEYDASIPAHVAFSAKSVETTLAKELSLAGKTQAHIAETEKYAHATYFLNGGVTERYPGEDHVLVESRKDVATHDQAPSMRAKEIADETIARMKQGVDFLFVNFANPDMVGHTGNVSAIVSALETVDTELGRVVDAAESLGYKLVITADHGNAELNKDQETGVTHTAHTTNDVPCIITGVTPKSVAIGGLADLAPTVLALMNIPRPAAMSGKNLLA